MPDMQIPAQRAMNVIGYVEQFTAPDLFRGWAAAPDHGSGETLQVVVLFDGIVVGMAERTEERADVTGVGSGPHGFVVRSTRPIGLRDILGGRVSLELRGSSSGGALTLSALLDYLSVLEAMEALIASSALPAYRFKDAASRLQQDESLTPLFRQQAMACLAVLHPATGPEVGRDLADALRTRLYAGDPQAAAAEPTPAELLLRFESLGENCEFGFVQRHFGCEPISLLRWSNVPLTSLLAALDAGFAGVGDAAYTELVPIWADEYGTRDTRYGFAAHTFIKVADIGDYDQMFKRQCQRLRWLRDALLDNLRANEKIFVYWRYDGITDAECMALFRALARHGARKLLCVRADPDREGTIFQVGEGPVVAAGDGPLVGYIDYFSQWENVPEYVNTASWLRICQAAANLLAPPD